MPILQYSHNQLEALRSTSSSIYLTGPNGCGKTTAGIGRLAWLLDQHVEGASILILVPQRTLAQPYYDFIQSDRLPPGSVPNIVTFAGLAKRMVELFWPLVSSAAGFSKAKVPPTFLTMESSQFFMAEVVEPMIAAGAFESVTIERSRLYAQILDNLNKAASIGMPYEEIGARLSAAWIGAASQLRIFLDVQQAAHGFRSFCMQNNLLDFSLQLEIFCSRIWQNFIGRQYLETTYRHLIYDNVEEDIPIAHDVISDWLPHFESSFIICDSNGGFRSFLGADPVSGQRLGEKCQDQHIFSQSFNLPEAILHLEAAYNSAIIDPPTTTVTPTINQVFTLTSYRQQIDMVAGVADTIKGYLGAGLAPSDIVIVSPFMSDSLRFILQQELVKLGIPNRSHRPSRSLRNEPDILAILTLAKMVYPDWKIPPKIESVRLAFMRTITNGDIVRADLLARTLYRSSTPSPHLGSFDTIDNSDHRNRISFTIGERFDELRHWLERAVKEPMELDVLVSRLFGEVLSQPGFGFSENIEAASCTARLIESIRKFRQTVGGIVGDSAGARYISLLESGILASQSIPSWNTRSPSVLVAPAYTYVMSNQEKAIQFWLDAGSSGWWQRLDQPLTHPYVLSRHWDSEHAWTDIDEYDHNQISMARLITGLVRRCTLRIHVTTVSMNELGNQEVGALLYATQRILRGLSKLSVETNV